MACSLSVPALPSLVNNQAPTFSFDHAKYVHPDAFGVRIAYVSAGSTCFTGAPGIPTFTPMLVNSVAGYTQTCSYTANGTTSTGLYCPTAYLQKFPNTGTLTISFRDVASNGVKPLPYMARFGTSPGPGVTTVTTTASTSTISTSTEQQSVYEDSSDY
ncbi:hypothetical protein IAQ61_007004 [Plenodomus lingam]|uniref:uncharacterized protein n=1 Tax=Leptosphaeria maculans TaxID=5022 RepID=UPI00331FE3C0|nr:hypothetical protein IAQ61_007004 [Plenodomus lingam]